MTDGTLFCGDEMDKIFEIYMDGHDDITAAKIEKVRESYMELVGPRFVGGDLNARTKAQELYLDLFTAARTF